MSDISTTRFYIDCEFDGHDGPLLSIAMVREDGDSIHIQVDVAAMDLWVIRNVIPLMDCHRAPKAAKVYLNEVGDLIRAFIGETERPTIIADSPVDIGRFCRALSTGSDGGWASADYPAMSFEVHNVDCYPTDLAGAVQHNAWWDAMALRQALTTRLAPDRTERAREAAEAWRIPANSDGTGELVKPRDHCVWGFEQGYLAALDSTRGMVEALEKCRQLFQQILDQDGREINPSNYSHDDVCHLNNGWVECFQIAEEGIATLQGTER